jgi:hypothetical protein
LVESNLKQNKTIDNKSEKMPSFEFSLEFKLLWQSSKYVEQMLIRSKISYSSKQSKFEIFFREKKSDFFFFLRAIDNYKDGCYSTLPSLLTRLSKLLSIFGEFGCTGLLSFWKGSWIFVTFVCSVLLKSSSSFSNFSFLIIFCGGWFKREKKY